MARPARSLEQHVLQASFRGRRHHQLLAREPLPPEWRLFAALQARYQAASSEPERRSVALQFEQAVTAVHAQAKARDGGLAGPGLEEQLSALGKPGSLPHLLAFFPALLRYPGGPLHGQPFQLEQWQRAFLRGIVEFQTVPDPSMFGRLLLAGGLCWLTVKPVDLPGDRFELSAMVVNLTGVGDCARHMTGQSLREWVPATGNRLDCPKRQASMYALSSEGTLQHGRTPAAALLDELWTFTSKRQVETHTALTAAIHKRADAYLLATSTAGSTPNSLLGRIYHDALSWDDVTVQREGCLTVAKNPDARALVWWYGAPADADPTDPKILRACNPASWINVSDLQQPVRQVFLSWVRPYESYAHVVTSESGNQTSEAAWPKYRAARSPRPR